MKPLPLPEFPKGQDTLTRHGANLLAKYIETHWKSKGYPAIVVETFPVPNISDHYGIRSNMVGGIPPLSDLQKRMVAGHAVASARA